jgi:hypothetical protein
VTSQRIILTKQTDIAVMPLIQIRKMLTANFGQDARWHLCGFSQMLQSVSGIVP